MTPGDPILWSFLCTSSPLHNNGLSREETSPLPMQLLFNTVLPIVCADGPHSIKKITNTSKNHNKEINIVRPFASIGPLNPSGWICWKIWLESWVSMQGHIGPQCKGTWGQNTRAEYKQSNQHAPLCPLTLPCSYWHAKGSYFGPKSPRSQTHFLSCDEPGGDAMPAAVLASLFLSSLLCSCLVFPTRSACPLYPQSHGKQNISSR